MNGALTGRHGGNLWHVEAARGGRLEIFSRVTSPKPHVPQVN